MRPMDAGNSVVAPPPFLVLWVLPDQGRYPVNWGERLRMS